MSTRKSLDAFSFRWRKQKWQKEKNQQMAENVADKQNGYLRRGMKGGFVEEAEVL